MKGLCLLSRIIDHLWTTLWQSRLAWHCLFTSASHAKWSSKWVKEIKYILLGRGVKANLFVLPWMCKAQVCFRPWLQSCTVAFLVMLCTSYNLSNASRDTTLVKWVRNYKKWAFTDITENKGTHYRRPVGDHCSQQNHSMEALNVLVWKPFKKGKLLN